MITKDNNEDKPLSVLRIVFNRHIESITDSERFKRLILNHLNYELKSEIHWHYEEFQCVFWERKKHSSNSDKGSFKIAVEIPEGLGNGKHRLRTLNFFEDFFERLPRTLINGSRFRVSDGKQLISATDDYQFMFEDPYQIKVKQSDRSVAMKTRFNSEKIELSEKVEIPEKTESGSYQELADGYSDALQSLTAEYSKILESTVETHNRQVLILLDRIAVAENDNKHLRKLMGLPTVKRKS